MSEDTSQNLRISFQLKRFPIDCVNYTDHHNRYREENPIAD